MGYLKNDSITVDAVLTKKGREILKDGGSLNISQFTLSDVGVDYTLFNTDHPSGSAFYGEAIENLPQLEASVHAEYNMKNRLISLNQNSIAIPALVVDSGLDSKGGNVRTFEKGEEASGQIVVRLVGYSSPTNQGVAVIIVNPGVVEPGIGAESVRTGTNGANRLSGTGVARDLLTSEEIPDAREFKINATINGTDRISTLNITPIQQSEAGKETIIIFRDYETGAETSVRIVNNITEPASTLLSQGGQGAST